MFGLFSKKKPPTALEAFIGLAYGNSPPPKTARLEDAVRIAREDLLLDLVPREEVAALAADLYRGPIPYSTNDLAVSIALNFFRRPDLIGKLQEAQLVARLMLLEWTQEKKVNSLLAKAFEDSLYKLYKPGT
jgi:hypothetical protein